MTVESRNGLARASHAGQIATEAPANPWASVGLLKPHAHGISDEPLRIDALATISAGRKMERNGKSYPQVSRDGTIHISDASGRAPGLAADLGAESWRVRRERPELVVWQDRADDRRMVVARLLFWRWLVETRRAS